MMDKYNYSITITHYNSPALLSRMLKSIPERDDIQIIVVMRVQKKIRRKYPSYLTETWN